MSIDDSFQLASLNKKLQQDEVIDLYKIFYIVISRWRYFLMANFITLICAFLYCTYMPPTYRVSSTLLINDVKNGGLMDNNQFIDGLRLWSGTQNIDNQIMILSSRALIRATLNDLPFEIEYYKRRLGNKVSLYPDSPIKVIPVTLDSLPRDIEFTFKYLENNKFSLEAESGDNFDLNIQASFGEIIKTPDGRFHIELSNDDWPANKPDHKMHFVFHSRKKLIERYVNRIRVEKVSKTGTILNLYLEGTNKTMDVEFLNKLTDIFLIKSLEKKNQEATRTIQFIDDQLIGISDSLVISENKLQQFRSQHKVMDLSAQGQVIIDQAMSLENQKARLGVEANYYGYLADYLLKDNFGQAPIAPATMGIIDPGLTKLVADLADLQGQLYSKSLGEKNPLQYQLAQRIRNTKEALRETLNGVIRSNNMAISEINEQIRTVNAQASALPVTERQLLGIERKYKLNDELYTFLLEKRAGAQIQKAANMPDNEIIDSSEADVSPVKPKRLMLYVLALIAGTGIPFLWILIVDTFNNKVTEDEDINRKTDIPISGHIPHTSLKKSTVVFDEPNSHIAESFRSLRSRMQFFLKDAKSPIILITSSMQKEGKTYNAINLASTYSLIGKKTVLVGFDLRKPKIYKDFGLSNDIGISTWLIGKNNLQEVTQQTKYENLFIITAGPIPPNPSELLALSKTEELISLLKENYECIIFDTSPIGTVSDTYHLVPYADTSILIVRHNMTSISLLKNTINELKISDIKSISIVVNDLGPEYARYGYKGRYDYGYRKEKSNL